LLDSLLQEIIKKWLVDVRAILKIEYFHLLKTTT